MKVTVRRAGPPDVPALARLRRAWAAESGADPGADPGFEERFAAWWERESGHRLWWLAQDGEAAAGMANLTVFDRMPGPGRPPSQWGYIGNAFVRPVLRDQGIGGTLLRAVLAYADEAGLVRVVLSPSPRSVPFYQRAGFTSADELMRRVRPDLR